MQESSSDKVVSTLSELMIRIMSPTLTNGTIASSDGAGLVMETGSKTSCANQ